MTEPMYTRAEMIAMLMKEYGRWRSIDSSDELMNGIQMGAMGAISNVLAQVFCPDNVAGAAPSG